MQKINLLGYTRPQLEELMLSLGQKKYKGGQMFNWLYGVRQYDFQLMTDLSKEVRGRLNEAYTVNVMEPEQEAVSADGTRKFLFRVDGGHPIETVLIPEGDRRTVCISAQAGCALACRFCATGTMGLLRDLTPGEIVSQLIFLRDRFGAGAFSSVVMMGMGEPLNNFDNVVDAVRIITDPFGLALAPKRITVSTSGVTPKIRKLADTGLRARLALSLHAATQEKRAKIMPVAQTFGLEKLMEAVRYYATTTKDRVTFEYILFKGFNDTNDDVKALAALVRGISCKINILAYNPVKGLPFERPSDEHVDWFARQLHPRVPAVTVRKSRGRDIEAACGQLAAREQTRSTSDG